jgi:hypothetical protein
MVHCPSFFFFTDKTISVPWMSKPNRKRAKRQATAKSPDPEYRNSSSEEDEKDGEYDNKEAIPFPLTQPDRKDPRAAFLSGHTYDSLSLAAPDLYYMALDFFEEESTSSRGKGIRLLVDICAAMKSDILSVSVWNFLVKCNGRSSDKTPHREGTGWIEDTVQKRNKYDCVREVRHFDVGLEGEARIVAWHVHYKGAE